MQEEVDNIYGSDYINIDGNYIHRTAIVGDNVSMGIGNVIMPYAVIGELGFIRGKQAQKGVVIIGNNNKFGIHSVVMSGVDGSTIIGSDNLIMNYVNVGHDVEIGNNCEITAGTILGGFSEVGEHTKIKMGCIVRNRVKIGTHCLIGMGSIVTQDIPDNTKYYTKPNKHFRRCD